MPRKKADTLDFEQSLNKLNQLVENMERGHLSLEESLKQFEAGVALIRECQKALAHAEQKVKILTKENGKDTLKPFEPNDSE